MEGYLGLERKETGMRQRAQKERAVGQAPVILLGFSCYSGIFLSDLVTYPRGKWIVWAQAAQSNGTLRVR